MRVTPCFSTTFPGSVNSQLPPRSEAKSTTTLPDFIDSIIAAVMSLGAGLPGISAVVIIMSTSLACSAKRAISAAMNSSLICLA